jgi:DNA polymerase-3 subunit epsilon
MPDRTLTLSCPLVVFDLETTGLDPATDRIVEIGCVKLLPAARGKPHAREVRTWRVNPGRPIPPAASQVHGISDADVATCPTFDALAREVLGFLEGCDLSGFHVEMFDVPLLAQEFERVGIDFPSWSPRVVDTRTLFVRREPRGLAAALAFYCGREHVGAHGAEADAQAAADVLLAQLSRYPDLDATVDALHAACHPVAEDALDASGKVRWVGGEAVLGFGKHTGKPLRQLAADTPDYLRWILKADFPADTKRIIGEALAGRYPEAPA